MSYSQRSVAASGGSGRTDRPGRSHPHRRIEHLLEDEELLKGPDVLEPAQETLGTLAGQPRTACALAVRDLGDAGDAGPRLINGLLDDPAGRRSRLWAAAHHRRTSGRRRLRLLLPELRGDARRRASNRSHGNRPPARDRNSRRRRSRCSHRNRLSGSPSLASSTKLLELIPAAHRQIIPPRSGPGRSAAPHDWSGLRWARTDGAPSLHLTRLALRLLLLGRLVKV